MDDVALGQFVQHRAYQGKLRSSFGSVRNSTEDANSVTRSLVVETIVQTLLLRLADALQGGFVVSHTFLFYFFLFFKLVTRTGFEPVIFSVKGRCPEPLDERAIVANGFGSANV
jgi:hypothetical protein